jgi:ABC-2 type transport system permease protein
MWAVYKREVKSYFLSPLGYVVMGFFLLVSGFFFTANNIFPMSSDFNAVLGNTSFIFMMLVPILTMRLLSEEKKTKTDQMLITSPLSLTAIVVGKYLAAVSVFLITLVVSFVYPIILLAFGQPSVGEMVSGYIGFFLMGCTFIAVGLFISALTENQITAATSTFGILLLLWVIDWVTPNINSPVVVSIVEWISVLKRFSNFMMGVLSPSPIIYYLSFTALFVFLTIRVIEKRRWSEG